MPDLSEQLNDDIEFFAHECKLKNKATNNIKIYELLKMIELDSKWEFI